MRKNIFKKNKPYIEFVSTIEGLEKIEELAPKSAKKYIPDWLKNMPNDGSKTVKICPSFPDLFSAAYVIPMWQDTMIKYDKVLDKWDTVTGTITEINFHSNNQMLDYVEASFQGVNGSLIFKTNCPWRIFTPPGYSVLQIPMFYHFNKDWSVLTGIIDTDIYHESNQQILYHGDGKEVFIPRGTPLAMYIPFKRDKFNLNNRFQTEEEKKDFDINDLNFKSMTFSTGYYRSLQRRRDKKKKN
jgi:hypothetical protein